MTSEFPTREISIFSDNDVYASLSSPRSGGGDTVTVRKNMCLGIRMIFLDLKYRSVALNVTFSEGHTFRLVAVYAPIRTG